MLLGGYELGEPLGRGGMGAVHRARGPAGEVAVKVILRGSADARDRFRREVRLQAELGPGFVPVLDAGEADGRLYLVMPLLLGGTLRDRLRQGPLDVPDVRDLGVALARALDRAHARGIVHRDLKPENIIFDGSGRPLIADIGLAKHFQGSARESISLSQTGAFRGTVGYVAPEQLLDAKNVGPEADVFALGAVLWECLAGRPAFAGETVLHVLTALEKHELPALRRLRPEVPRGLARALEKALAAAPEGRFPTAAAFARALEAPEPRRSWARVAVVLGLAAGVLGVVKVVKKDRPAPPPIPVVKRPDPVLELLARADAAIKRGDLEEALEDYTRAIELDPGNAGAYSKRGSLRAFAMRRDVGLARADMDRAIELDPRCADALNNRGALAMFAGDLDRALRDVSLAVEADPNLGRGWANLGIIHAKLGSFATARAFFERCLELAPPGPEADSIRERLRRLPR